MIVLRNLLFYAAFYLGSVYFVLGSLVAMATVSEERFRKFPNAWSHFHRWCVNHILGIDVRVEGVRPEGQSFFAIKHESFFEAIDLATMLDEPVPYAKEELFRIPGWGRVARAYGGIAVAREAGAKGLRSMLTESRKHIDSGRQLAIFPEGKRVPHGTRPPLRAGFAGLYKLLRLPVVPVAVNSGPVYQRLWKPRGTITIRFGEPIPPGLPREELEARVHAAINELNS